MIPQREMVVNPGKIRQKNEMIILDAAEKEFSENGYKGATIKKIADRAELPKANIHYYFKSKLELYGAVLNNIVESTNAAFGKIDANEDPAKTLAQYIRAKMQFSKENPEASRIFASEIIGGAQYLGDYLREELKSWLDDKAELFKAWADQGKMDYVDPYHAMFLIWGATQFYADSSVQVESTLGKVRLDDLDFVQATHSLIAMTLKACGIQMPDAMANEFSQELEKAKIAKEAEVIAAVEFSISEVEPAKEQSIQTPDTLAYGIKHV